MLRVEQLCREVDGKLIVNHINLAVQPGDMIAIIGRSGAGKSSFLRLINRLDEPTSGTVFLDGEDYRQIKPRELRRRVGMVMQSAYLFPGIVAENLRFGPSQQDKALSDAEVDLLLEQVGLAGFAGRGVNFLSGGEAQRVSLARTLANQPEVLLLDEPTSALDERSEREIEELLTRVIRDRNLTSLMVTHDTAQAARIANRAILIENGRLVRDGTVQEVLDDQSVLP